MSVKIALFLDSLKVMWKFLYQLASPPTFYRLSGSVIPWLSFMAAFTLVLGVFWGLVYAPADYQQGDAFRIIYVHVPSAFLSMTLYGWMGFLAILLLVWRIKIAGMLLHLIAQLGLSMTFLALVTGSIWGKPMWGAWWVWDARLTSMLILLFLYIGVIALYNAYESSATGAKAAAILAIVGVVNLPIIKYSVVWWNTLHQGATFTLTAKPKMPAEMWLPLVLMILGFYTLFTLLTVLKTRTIILQRERRTQWVRELVQTQASGMESKNGL